MQFNWKVIIHILGILLLMNAFFMLTCIPFSLYYNDGDFIPLILSAGISAFVGLAAFFFTRNFSTKDFKKKEGYLVVTGGWIFISLFGSLPYFLSGEIPSFTDAFFETISGFSTTGASILIDIESVGKGILFWRSLTQWIGGMGIIVLTVAILPLLGIGGMQLFVAEAPGISTDKLQPRIKETAKRLWLIYLGLTFAELIVLMFGGMDFYDALNHSLTTMSSGGFSTKNASIAYYHSPFIEYVIIIFMILAGTNFTMTYFALHNRFGKVFRNEEFRIYLFVLAFAGVLATVGIYHLGNSSIEKSFREGLFQVVSVITTTGFITADFTAWTPFLTLLFFILMFFGASAGSTAGGVKIVRHLILLKNSILELKRQIHPAAIIPVRFNGKAISRDITYNILAFIMIYISIFAIGSLIMGLLGLDFVSSIGAVATCLGNIGPGLGTVGPIYNFAHLPDLAKWVLSFLMLIGRLELFTVLILFTPYFWKKF